MANFDVQIQDLVGTFSDQTAMDDFMTAGAKEIINSLPSNLLYKCADKSTLSNSPSTLSNMDTKGKVLGVLRLDADSSGIQRPCRLVSNFKRGRIQDSSDMELATATDPAYVIYDNTLEVYPTPTANQTAEVEFVSFPTVDASSASTIANFPDEAEYLVVLYASIKALQQLMTAKHNNTNISDAFTKLNNALADGTASATAAVSKFENADSESVFGDESTFLTNDSQLTRVKSALDDAEDVINGNEPTATTDAYGALAEEDVEIVTSALNIAQTEISRAQVHLSEWNAIGDMRVKEINAYLSAAQGHASEIQARLNVDNTEYSWYEKQQLKLQSDYEKGLARLVGA
tara:strand:+ start:923 stop:1960 length:1038 start_codon:yes stop_codon:yes gene_type:complete